MKRIIFALLLLPQLVYAQYLADVFNLEMSDDVSQMKIGKTFSQDTTLIWGEKSKISGLSISGTAVLNSDNDSYIRVTLVDEYGYEFLVYENYPALSDNLTSVFDNIALETVILDNVTPQCLKITMLNASLKLESVNTPTSTTNAKNPATIQKAQTQYIVDRLNTILRKKNMTWRARVTSVSEMSYSEKKDMYGGVVPQLYGFEHYAGGVFVMPGEYLNSLSPRSSDNYVTEWDWRNRHGKNWMTPVKYHMSCAACWAFASISEIEAYANLYYNKLINLDLSEEEIVSCSVQNGCRGGTESSAFDYVKNYGVVNEACFEFRDSVRDCAEKCSNPVERIFIQNHRNISINEDSVKNYLFKCPLTIAIGAWRHSMVIVGYKTIEEGDKIYMGNYMGNNATVDYIIINNNEHQNLIGKTAWLLKNSWQPWGDNGYLYLIVDMNYSKVWRVLSLTGKITSLNYNDSDIICEDADGDGYYFWGVSEGKPSGIPEWVPETKDGDESNPTKGALDNSGNLEDLSLNNYFEHVVSGIETCTNRESVYTNIRIPFASKLCVKNIYNIFGQVNVYIESGGELIIDEGVITNANIIMSSGGKLTINNGGKIVMRTNTNFSAPLGAIVDISNGEILRSNGF